MPPPAFIAENLGCQVNRNGSTQEVAVTQASHQTGIEAEPKRVAGLLATERERIRSRIRDGLVDYNLLKSSSGLWLLYR